MEGYNHSQEPLSLKKEFHYKRFGLQHDSPFNFLRSQWQSKPKSRCFLAYRCVLGAFFGTSAFVVTNTVLIFRFGHFFIYVTNWSFYMCAITSVYAAILQTVYHCHKETWVPPSCVIKCYWICFWITLCAEHVVAIAYWAFIYPSKTERTSVSNLFSISAHSLPPIVFTIDHFLAAHPARILHFVYPLGFSLIYLGFTIIFYLAGGRDRYGRSYIYEFLDFNNPKRAALYATLLHCLLVACSIFQYGVYRLRTCLARKLGKLILDIT